MAVTSVSVVCLLLISPVFGEGLIGFDGNQIVRPKHGKKGMLNHHHNQQMNVADATEGHHQPKQLAHIADQEEEPANPHHVTHGVVPRHPKSAIRGMVQQREHHKHKKKEAEAEMEAAKREDEAEQDSESHEHQHQHAAQDVDWEGVTSDEVAAERMANLGAAPAPGPGPAPGDWIRSMDTKMPVAEQGFQGEKVFHNDKETMAADWLVEFGPGQGGEKNIKKLCDKLETNANGKKNRWCRIHGYLGSRFKKKKAPEEDEESLAARTSADLFVVAVSAAAVISGWHY
jgi:hypothetical protein